MGTPVKRRRTRSKSGDRRRALIGFIVTIVVLTGVFLISSALSSPDSANEVDSSRPVQLAEGDAVQDARKLLESGDTTGALAVLQDRLTVDSSDSDAAALIDEIESTPPKEEPDEATPDDPPPNETDAATRMLDPVEDLSILLPGDVEGFTSGIVVTGPSDVQVNFDPVVGSDTEVDIRTALVAVHDLQDHQSALAFVENVSRAGYPADGEVLSLSGVEAYYGTDGAARSTISFAVGRFAFEVVAAAGGADASYARVHMEQIASAFPALR